MGRKVFSWSCKVSTKIAKCFANLSPVKDFTFSHVLPARHTMGQTASKRPETSILEWISPILILMVLIHPYGSPWVPLVPKSHYKLIESFKFTRYVARNHMQFSPFSPFQWNYYIELHDSSNVLDSRGRRGILRKESIKRKILLRSQVKFYIFYMSSAKYPCDC